MPRVTKEHNTRIIKQLYEKQDRRCAVCDLEIAHKNEKGHIVRKYEDRSGLVICASCNLLVNYIRKHGTGLRFERAVRLVNTGAV